MMPFPGGAEGISNGTLIFSIGAAVFYLAALERSPNFRRSVIKTMAVAMLALLAVIEGGPLLLIAALAASAMGDAFLSRDGDTAFLGGLGSFLVGHLLYVALFVTEGAGVPLIMAEPARIAIAVVMIAAAGMMLPRLRQAAPPALRAPVELYTAAILAMGLAALTVPGPWVVFGAMMFMASDALLGADRFLLAGESSLRTAIRHGVWVLYYAAQAVITLGVLLGGV